VKIKTRSHKTQPQFLFNWKKEIWEAQAVGEMRRGFFLGQVGLPKKIL